MQSVFFLICSITFLLIAYGEFTFYRDAGHLHATITKKFSTFTREEDVPVGKQDLDLGKKIRVRLDPTQSDGREAAVLVDKNFWQEVNTTNQTLLWCFPTRPVWAFWSPMVRYRKRRANWLAAGSLAAMCLVLAAVQ